MNPLAGLKKFSPGRNVCGRITGQRKVAATVSTSKDDRLAIEHEWSLAFCDGPDGPPLDMIPVFWDRQMGPAWGRMLGLWIDRKLGETKSNMLNGFPTGTHFDWQWAEVIHNARRES